MMNFIQGESWTQDLKLLHNGQAIKVGPGAESDSFLHEIEVVLKVNTRVQARYRYPVSDDFPKHDILEISDLDENVLRLKITRNQSRFFEPGYLTAITTIRYRDAEHPEGRPFEVVQILGYMLKSDFAMRFA
jgi:hypothetical protein